MQSFFMQANAPVPPSRRLTGSSAFPRGTKPDQGFFSSNSPGPFPPFHAPLSVLEASKTNLGMDAPAPDRLSKVAGVNIEVPHQSPLSPTGH